MTLRPLGRTDVRLSPIGLGCWQFSAGKGLVGGYWPALPPERVREIVQTSVDAGVNWFDTAEAYGGGESEAALARALREVGKKPGEVVIATKWLPFFRGAASITSTIEERLRHLGGFPIDLHQIHNAYGSYSSRKAQLDRMAQLVAERKIRYVGVSNYDARQMRAAHAHLARHGIPLVSNQMQYSLLNRSIERNGVMDAAKELGITIIAYSPLAQGVLTGRFHAAPEQVRALKGPRKWMPHFRRLERSRPLIDALNRIAQARGATPSQVALAWLLTFHGDTVVAIPGASSARQAQQNAGAMKVELGRAELDELDRLSR